MARFCVTMSQCPKTWRLHTRVSQTVGLNWTTYAKRYVAVLQSGRRNVFVLRCGVIKSEREARCGADKSSLNYRKKTLHMRVSKMALAGADFP